MFNSFFNAVRRWAGYNPPHRPQPWHTTLTAQPGIQCKLWCTQEIATTLFIHEA